MPLRTPDGRYIVVRGRLWRATNPSLPEDEARFWRSSLMKARREVAEARRTDDPERMRAARAAVQTSKEKLGDRGVPWWDDGAKDWNRYLVKNTPYAKWFEDQDRAD